MRVNPFPNNILCVLMHPANKSIDIDMMICVSSTVKHCGACGPAVLASQEYDDIL